MSENEHNEKEKKSIWRVLMGDRDDDGDMEYEEDGVDNGVDINDAVNSGSGYPRAAAQAGGVPQFVLVRPEEFNDSISIADHIIAKKTVVLNLDNTGKDLAQRILDVLSGTSYAVGAKINKVSINTFIIIPYGSNFSGDKMNTIDTESFKLE